MLTNLLQKSYKQVHQNLTVRIKKFGFSQAAIHAVNIYIFCTLLNSSDNQAHSSPVCFSSSLFQSEL